MGSHAFSVETTLATTSLSDPVSKDSKGFTVWKTRASPYSNPKSHIHRDTSTARGDANSTLYEHSSRSLAEALKTTIMGKSRPRGESDLGKPTLQTRGIANSYAFPPTSPGSPMLSPETPKASRQLSAVSEEQSHSNFSIEIITALLIPLPFLLSSLANNRSIYLDHSKHSATTEAAEDILEETASTALPVTANVSNLLLACVLTSLTLIAVGLLGRMHLSVSPFAQRKGQRLNAKGLPVKDASISSWSNLRTVMKRMLSVGLPYLASLELGGARTGIILLSAVAGGLLDVDPSSGDSPTQSVWRRAVKSRKWTCALFFLCLFFDIFARGQSIPPSSIIRGYVALGKSVLFLQPPLPAASLSPTQAAMMRRTSSQMPSSPWQTPKDSTMFRRTHVSPLVASALDTNLTLAAGAALAAVTTVLMLLLSSALVVDATSLVLSMASFVASVGLYCFTRPSVLSTSPYLGYGAGVLATTILGVLTMPGSLSWKVPFAISCLLSLVVLQLDTGALNLKEKSMEGHRHGDHHHDHSHHHTGEGPSKFTKFLLQHTSEMPLIHSILLEKESRRIVYFMSINLAFMFIQTFYALAAGSLGLLSDSIHMFFDCVGLLAGLIAAVMSKWPPNSRFPYGYGKVETLSGLGNGIFLMIISIEIISESFERFVEGTHLKHLNELLVVSAGGLIVNLLGLKFIGHHHHGHSHDHSHSHGHSNGHQANITGNGNGARKSSHSHSHSNSSSGSSLPSVEEHPDHHAQNHSHDHHSHHGHHHENENMAGIYLHILADTMGSVAVIVSTILTSYTGWTIWDPMASCIISVLIIGASYPLVVGSAKKLLLTVPEDDEYALRNALQELSVLRGVDGYAVPKFWVNDAETDGEHHHHDHDHGHGHGHGNSHQHERKPSCESAHHPIHGVIHVIADHKADLEDVRSRVQTFLRGRNVNIVAHVERKGTRCWCGGGKLQ